MNKQKVLCVATHPIDLSDGAPLGPGEMASIDTDDEHNALLLGSDLVIVVETPPPSSSSSSSPSPAPVPQSEATSAPSTGGSTS